jgi:predicted RNA-binding Zn-ribbon protein involved in translation (DUF1610 family)
MLIEKYQCEECLWTGTRDECEIDFPEDTPVCPTCGNKELIMEEL